MRLHWRDGSYLLKMLGLLGLAKAWEAPAGTGSSRFVVAAIVTVVFAVGARLVRGVDNSGAVAGALVSFALFAAAGPAAFLALLVVFALTWMATRFGQSRKRKLGTAERGGGRTASQVLANLSVAAICAVLYARLNRPVLLVMMFAALAEAAADTVSSEVGQACSERARLITTWQQVPAGTDGGVSLSGTIAGSAAAVVIGATAFAAGLPGLAVTVVIVAAVAGMMMDSVLGAAFERRNLVNNDGVNLCGTILAALLAFLVA